ncbi:retroviral-like aspartic protease family protein [Empedobacter falsenii]|uniref:retropepsin-like aspartic protease family protein n=1 Tax=Empedobacter falsenii TaxID=343874 RepID=UPI00056EA55B|nr:retropepsin-like aspartic protease [Empedobacter falsenii]
MNKFVIISCCLVFINCSKSGQRNQRSSSNETLTINAFENEINTVEKKVKEIVSEENLSPIKTKIELPFVTDGGVKIVNIKVNNIPLDFIFDTGASLISISETEARFLVKQGTLTEDDFIGVQQFMDANGDISEGLLVNLKEIDIQGYKLYNVKASIVQNSEAPLLLGQSLLEKFARVTIDNQNEKIILQ